MNQNRLYFFHTNADYLVGLRLPMLAAFVEAGYSVSAFAPNMDDKSQAFLARYGISGRTYSLNATGLNLVRDVFQALRLSLLLRRESPRIVFANNIKPVVFVSLAAALARVPVRLALVGGLGYAFTKAPGGRDSIKRTSARVVASLLYAFAFRVCSRVIFHNSDDREMLVASGICPRGRAEVVWGSGVDVDTFIPTTKPVDPTFVFVGRLLGDKGVREYLQAARETKRAFPAARFLLVGDADNNPSSIKRSEFQKLVEDGCIEWTGKVDDVRPYLQASSVFVLPSYREGVPRSTLEAMACGLAIVTTDAPGCRDTVCAGVNGILVPVGDARSLAAVLISLCGDPRLVAKMGEASRIIAERRFSTRSINEAMVTIVQESSSK